MGLNMPLISPDLGHFYYLIGAITPDFQFGKDILVVGIVYGGSPAHDPDELHIGNPDHGVAVVLWQVYDQKGRPKRTKHLHPPLGSGRMLGERVEHLSGYEVLIQLRNKGFRVLLNVSPEVHRIAIKVVIDFCVSALLR